MHRETKHHHYDRSSPAWPETHFSQPYRIGSVDFICKPSIEFHFHPHRVLILPRTSILVCLLWSTGILIFDQACTA